MGRIVVNKHVNNGAIVSPDNFIHKGEIIISNEVGSEGIFILNNNRETVFISKNNGGGEDTPSSQHVLLSTAQYDELMKNGKVIIDGEEIFYDNNTYYAVYEDVE